MRDFRDAKAMARALRDALKAKAIEITQTEALELIAKAFGYKNWNILRSRLPNRSQAMSDCFRPVALPCQRNAELEQATVTGSEPIRRRSATTTSPTPPSSL
jgi:hypothetical protein